jgi:hypothetical protein
MRRDNWGWSSLVLLVAVVLLAAVERFRQSNFQKGGGASRDDGGKLIVGEPLTHGNLTIFLVSSERLKDQDRFITLDEGLAAGTVEIVELGSLPSPADDKSLFPDPCASHQLPTTPPPSSEDPFQDGPDVNQLLVSNRSTWPLYLMSGEILVGGQQDRSLAKELIVPPRTRRMPIDVFCVEQGRWAHRELPQVARVSNALAALNSPSGLSVNELTDKAKAGRFPQSGAALSKSARLTLQEGKGQRQVWDVVAQVNNQSGADSDSDAFTANYVEPQVVDKLEPYLEALNEQVTASPRVVGAIMAINGKIEVVDIFESTPLFRKLWPKLLKSYALDAVAAADAEVEAKCSLADAEEFLDRVQTAQSEATEDNEGELTTLADTDDVLTFSLHDRGDVRSARGTAAMGGGMGGSVHSAGFGK